MAINYYIFFTICLFFTKFAMTINGGPSSTNNQKPRTINRIAHPRNIEGQLAAGDHIPHTNQPTNNATNGHQNDQNANSENSDLLDNSATEQHSSVHEGNNAGRPTENLIIENEHRAHFFDQGKSIDTTSPSGYSNANATKLDETNDHQQLVSEGGNDDDDKRKMNDMEEEDSNNDPVVSECCPICLQPFTEASNKKVLSNCGHQFDVNCIDQWLHSKNSCPVCRCEVDGDERPNGHEQTEPPRVITTNTMNTMFRDFSGNF